MSILMISFRHFVDSDLHTFGVEISSRNFHYIDPRSLYRLINYIFVNSDG